MKIPSPGIAIGGGRNKPPAILRSKKPSLVKVKGRNKRVGRTDCKQQQIYGNMKAMYDVERKLGNKSMCCCWERLESKHEAKPNQTTN